MTSTTLNYKGGFKAAFVKTFKQQLPGAIVLILLAFVASIFMAATTIISNTRDTISNTKVNITYDSVLLVNYFCVICIIFSFFLAVQMFKEIYSKRACDVFFALPIKRSEYFIAKYLYGAAVNAVAVVVCAAVNVVILLSASTKLVKYTIDFSEFLKSVAVFLFNLLLIYTIFIFCAVLSGKKVQYFFFAVIALFAPVGITSGAISIINSIWGVDVNSYFASIIHPVQNILLLWESSIEYVLFVDKYLLIIIVEIIEAAALFIIGFRVFKKRKAETAEFEPSGKVIPLMFLVLLVAAVFIQLAAEMKYFIAIPLALVFAVIATILFSGIFYKKVFAKNTAISFAVGSVLCIFFVLMVNLPGYSGYVKYVPETDEIESVELIDGSMSYMNYNSFSYYSDGLPYDYFETSDLYKFTTEESIKNAVNLHKKIVDDETIKKGKAINSNTWGDMMSYDYEYENCYDCRIVYHLKKGKVVTRRYSVPVKMISDEMVALMRNEEALSQFGVTSINTDDFLFSTFNSEKYDDENDNNSQKTKDMNKEQFIGFLDAYKNDLLNNISDADFIDYLSVYTGYYADIYSDKYGDSYYYDAVETQSTEDVEYDNYWVYVAYLNSNLSEADREYYRSLSNAELYRLSADSEEYYEKIASDSIYIYPEHKQTSKYLQSIGMIE